jgi:hypothetical protein
VLLSYIKAYMTVVHDLCATEIWPGAMWAAFIRFSTCQVYPVSNLADFLRTVEIRHQVKCDGMLPTGVFLQGLRVTCLWHGGSAVFRSSRNELRIESHAIDKQLVYALPYTQLDKLCVCVGKVNWTVFQNCLLCYSYTACSNSLCPAILM